MTNFAGKVKVSKTHCRVIVIITENSWCIDCHSVSVVTSDQCGQVWDQDHCHHTDVCSVESHLPLSYTGVSLVWITLRQGVQKIFW